MFGGAVFSGEMCHLHCVTLALATNSPYCSCALDIHQRTLRFPIGIIRHGGSVGPTEKKTHIPKTALVERARLPQPAQSMQPPDSRIPAAPLGTAAALMSSSVTDGAG